MVQIIEPQTQNIVNVIISGKLNDREIDLLNKKVTETRNKYGKVRMYLEIPHFEGYTLQGFLEDLKRSLEHRKDFEKVVVVTNHEWIGRMGNIANILFKANIKYFHLDEKELAHHWIAQ